MKLLVVDGDAAHLARLQESLAGRYQLLVSQSGHEAVALAAEHRPALVLMDVTTSDLNGHDACRQIKAAADPQEPPHVLLISSRATAEARVLGYAAGADDYLIRPFDDEELLAKVRIHQRLCQAMHDLRQARAMLAQDNQTLSSIVMEQTAELIESRDMIVFALANLADSRDPETGEHLMRIREYCRILAQWLRENGPYREQIHPGFIENLYLSSPLHDIGKVGVPDAVLLKPGRLTDSEFELMKQHTEIGAQALEEVLRHGAGGGFLKMAIQIARSHHERWDGSGYPQRLVGLAIPLSARIAAVADVFDALTSVRVYKAAFTPQVARLMMVAESGRHFDPVLIEAFEACFDALIEARERFEPAPQVAPTQSQEQAA